MSAAASVPKKLTVQPSHGVALYKSTRDVPETWGCWLGRRISEIGCDCLLPCVKCCCCCCMEILSPEQHVEKELERLKLSDGEPVSDHNSKLVAKAIIQNPGRYSVLSSFTLFSEAQNFVFKLNLSGTNLETDEPISGTALALYPCSKIQNICKFFPQLTELNLSKCNIGTRTYQREQPNINCTIHCLQAISTLQNLVKLDLSYNPITEFTALKNTLANLTKLRVLNLTGCTHISTDTKKSIQSNRETVLRIIDEEPAEGKEEKKS
jgi:hypothetical protein